MNSLLSNLKRRSRTRSKTEVTSPSKAKPLDILPGLSEEDEGRASTSSTSSASSCFSPTTSASRASLFSPLSPSSSKTERKRSSRRVVLTGVEGLSFEDFFPLSDEPPRPAPRPPVAKPATSVAEPQIALISEPAACESPLDSIDLRFSGINFPFEFSSPSSSSLALSIRSQSPTPSVASSRTTSTTASTSTTVSRCNIFTPPTSDDESQPLHTSNLKRAPTIKSQHASVFYAKSIASKRTSSATVTQVEEESSDSEDAAWYANDISDMLTLTTPLPPAYPLGVRSSADLKARPDSLPPPPRAAGPGRSRNSKPLPNLPRLSVQPSPTCGPSAQLDPTFPLKKRHHPIPNRPPPPPPIRIECPSPTMEEKTDELLALLASAAMDTGFLGTGLIGPLTLPPASTPVTPSSVFAIASPESPRPPPRMTIPADIFELEEEQIPEEHSGIEIELTSPTWPTSPQSISLYSQASMSTDTIFGSFSPCSTAFEFDLVSPMEVAAMPDSPVVGMCSDNTPERVLRSRWSCSTLSSTVDSHPRQVPPSASSWMLRFNLGSSSPSKKIGKSSRPSLNRPNSKSSLKNFSSSKRTEHYRHGSNVSDAASDSDDSITGNKLRRKPIPIEIFMRT